MLGVEAHENGLAISLLERLHNVYSRHPQCEAYTASLIGNYRCVPEIVRFSSQLYYESSLQCKVSQNSDFLYPIQFICSSIENADHSVDTDEVEASIVLNRVKYFKSSGHKASDVCIVSPSSAQVIDALIH